MVVDGRFFFGDVKIIDVDLFGRFVVMNVLMDVKIVMKGRDMISFDVVKNNFLGDFLV